MIQITLYMDNFYKKITPKHKHLFSLQGGLANQITET